MPGDKQLILDLFEEDLPAAEHQAQSLGLVLKRGEGENNLDLFIPYKAPDNQDYLIRLRFDNYDAQPPSFQFVNPANAEETGPQWWPRMDGLGYPRGDHGEVVFCTPGIREYHEHVSHRGEQHKKETWKMARIIVLAWKYLNTSGNYAGRGGI